MGKWFRRHEAKLRSLFFHECLLSKLLCRLVRSFFLLSSLLWLWNVCEIKVARAMSCADRMAKITCFQHVSSWGADNSVFMRLSARCFSRNFVPDPLHGEARWLFADSYARPSTGIVSLAAAKCALSTFGIISRKVCAYLPLCCFILTVSARLCSIPSPGNYAWPILARLSCSPHGVLSRKRAVCKAM